MRTFAYLLVRCFGRLIAPCSSFVFFGLIPTLTLYVEVISVLAICLVFRDCSQSHSEQASIIQQRRTWENLKVTSKFMCPTKRNIFGVDAALLTDVIKDSNLRVVEQDHKLSKLCWPTPTSCLLEAKRVSKSLEIVVSVIKTRRRYAVGVPV